jgi:hypothetical protein
MITAQRILNIIQAITNVTQKECNANNNWHTHLMVWASPIKPVVIVMAIIFNATKVIYETTYFDITALPFIFTRRPMVLHGRS